MSRRPCRGLQASGVVLMKKSNFATEKAQE